MKLLVIYAVEEERIDVPFEGEVFYVKTGIGKVKAAVKAQEAIINIKPDFVLNIGTAGSVKHAVGDIIVCSDFLDRDLIKINHPEITSKLQIDKDNLVKVFSKLPIDNNYECGTGDSFVLKAEDLTSDVCDMEAFAIATVCEYYKVPFVAVKYVSDKVGENNLKMWEETLANARTGLSFFFKTLHS